MEKKKKSFFERLTGSVAVEEEPEEKEYSAKGLRTNGRNAVSSNWIEEADDEAELSVDVYQTPTEIVVQTMVAGVKPEDLEIAVTRDTVTIRGEREESSIIDSENYFSQELYWGKFSRTIALPAEVEPEEVEATERHGLLSIKVKKVDKGKKSNVKVRSL